MKTKSQLWLLCLRSHLEPNTENKWDWKIGEDNLRQRNRGGIGEGSLLVSPPDPESSLPPSKEYILFFLGSTISKEEVEAVTKIQASVRGYIARNKLKSKCRRAPSAGRGLYDSINGNHCISGLWCRYLCSISVRGSGILVRYTERKKS